jgi:hypothetical protein
LTASILSIQDFAITVLYVQLLGLETLKYSIKQPKLITFITTLDFITCLRHRSMQRCAHSKNLIVRELLIR